MSLGFDKDYYLAAKLKDIQAKHPEEWKDKTVEDLESFFQNDHSLTAEQHYEKYGYKEGLAPNKFFDADEYLAAKYNQMVKAGKAATLAEAKEKFAAGWADNDPYLHYIKYGSSEGVNPSNAFDESGYIDAKVKDMVAKGKYPDEEAALKAFKASGLTALEHYIAFGIKEDGIDPVKVSDEERVSVEGKTISLAKGSDIVLPEGVALPEGVKEEAVKRVTSDDDVINGLSSSLSSEKTLDRTDQIDGGEGKDTLKLSMKSDFTGFTSDGKMTNVENLELTNEGSIGRTFDASGVTGLEKVKIDASKAGVNLKDLSSLVEIELSDLAGGGKFTAAYLEKSAVDTSKDDVQVITLSNVGTGGETVKYTDLDIDKVEAAEITSSGDKGNYVDLKEMADAKIIVVKGDSAIDIEGVGAAVTEFDASAAKGDVKANLKDASLSVLKTGAGNDEVSIDVNKFLINGEISGGEGSDVLKLSSAAGIAKTILPTISGFETIEIGSLNAALTISGENISDLAKVVLSSAFNQNTGFYNLTSSDLVIESNNVTNNNTFTASNKGKTTLNFTAASDSIKDSEKDSAFSLADFSFMNSTEAVINVGKYTQVDSDITLSTAGTFTLNVESGMSTGSTPSEQTMFKGKITAVDAENFVINASGGLGSDLTTNAAEFTLGEAKSGKITTGKSNSFVKLEASALETLDIAANGDLDLAAGSGNFNNLQVLTIDTKGDFSLASGLNLVSISELNLSGDTADSEVNLNNLGDNELEHDINITAAGLSDDLNIGSINAGKASANIDVSGMTHGSVTITGIDADESVVINADGLGGELTFGTIKAKSVDINAASNTAGFNDSLGNSLDIEVSNDVSLIGAAHHDNKAEIKAKGTSLTANLVGGLLDDEYSIVTENAKNTSKIVVNGQLGIGTNKFNVNASDELETGVTIDAEGMDIGSGGSSTLLGGGAADVIKGTAGSDKITGNDGADKLYGGEGNDTFKFDADDVAAGEIIDGGAGDNDVIEVSHATDFSGATISNIELIEFTAGVEAKFNFTAAGSNFKGSAGNNTINFEASASDRDLDLSKVSLTDWEAGDSLKVTGNASDNVIKGSGEKDIIIGGEGKDTLTGGAGADTFIVNGTADLANNESIDGGNDSDVLQITATTDFTANTGVSIENMETVEFAQDSGASTITFGFSMLDTQDDATITGKIAKDATITGKSGVDDVLVFKADGSNDVNLSTLEEFTNWSDSGDTVKVTGNDNSNVIVGSIKADIIEGGAGVDDMTGGAEADTFVINSGDAGTTGTEVIRSYDAGASGDKLDLDSALSIMVNKGSTDVKAAISGGGGSEVVNATVTNGVITLGGGDASAIDTVEELIAVFNLVGGAGQQDVAAVEMDGNTYVISESDNTTVSDVVQLVGITGVTKVSETNDANTVFVDVS